MISAKLSCVSHQMLDLLLTKTETDDLPFVIPNFDLFGSLDKVFSEQTSDVFGIHPEMEFPYIYEYMSLNEAFEKYRNGNLHVNIFEAPLDCHSCLPDKWIVAAESRGIPKKHRLSLVMTNAPKCTPFHTDPVRGCGGFMYLIEGVKQWTFKLPDDKLLDITLHPGSLLWFPKLMQHSVKTVVSSFGVGGYL